MSKISPAVDRAVRIELLRARAAVEREALAQGLGDVAVSLSPSHLVRSLLPRFSGGQGTSRMAWQAVSLLRRYPVVFSTMSALFLGGNKRSKVLKLGTGAVVAWQVFRAWRSRQAREHEEGDGHASRHRS